MVSLKALAVAYAAVNLLGVDASPCRPSSLTSATLSSSETQTLSSVLSASTPGSSAIPTDTTTSKDLTVSSDGATTGVSTVSGSETLSYSVSLSEPTTSNIATSSTIATSSNPTTSVHLTESSGSITSAEITTSGSSTMSAETTTSAETTATTDTTESTDTTTAAGSDITTGSDTTTATDTTTAVDTTTTAPDTTTTMGSTTTSEEPTTTTSACVEPTNMLREGGFEPPSTGSWGFYWSGGYVDGNAANPRTGTGAAVLPVPDGQERRMEQRVHIVPGTEYTISFYYALSEVPSVNTECFLFTTFDYYTTLKKVSIPSDTDYHQYTASFISADNLDPAIEIGVACPQANNGVTIQVFIDDASVTGAACESTPPTSTLLVPAQPEPANCPVNLAQVPGFEQANGERGWKFFNLGEFVEDESNARTGTWEARLPSESGPNDGTYLEQRFTSQQLVAGETYDFRFFWKPESLPDNGECSIYGGYNDRINLGIDRVNFGATSSTGYTIYSKRFIMPADDLLLQIVFLCSSSNGQQLQGSVFVDDTALIKVGGCEAYPETGALIENPSFETQATEDSTYAWFGTSGVSIKAGTTPNGPSPNTGNNYLYIELGSTRKSATITKPLASSLNLGQSYEVSFSWTAGAAYTTGECSFTITLGSTTDTINLSSEVTPYEYQVFATSLMASDAASSMSLEVRCRDAFPDFAFDDFTLQ
ncbi:hypothetical protein NW768_009681 [Fusarium equiseti]|uniref:CBM-cenC domain-containing protein n=1 Tax=Fusarium equiseti TaxID=61235 RepID=A0ABQ8R291_FUSEQ|nr:hypothetical protein NW768_009681 [Fusarium equiseti]